MADLSQLRAEAAELLALDEKRTPGDWIADDFCEVDGEVRRLGTSDGTDKYYHRTQTIAYFQGEAEPDPEDEARGVPFISEPRMKFNCQFAAQAPRMGALIRKLLEALEKAQSDADKTEKEFDQCLQERDRAQDCLQQTHLNLGGDGEWAARIPTPPPPDSGDLHLDVPALAEEVHAKLERLRNPPETAWLCERGDSGPPNYVCINPSGFFDWTDDVNKALRLCRREDADAVAAIVEDCWRVAEHRWG